jgi:hypothetical protein
MSFALLVRYCAFAAIIFVLGFWRGYRSGVRDTEERWSQAVSRADAQRKWEAREREGAGR